MVAERSPLGQSNLGYNIGFKFDSNTLNNIFISPFIIQVLIGILLGDGNIRKPNKNGNPQIQYNQGFVHLNHILNIFFYIISNTYSFTIISSKT